jgi:hypothetical protein
LPTIGFRRYRIVAPEKRVKTPEKERCTAKIFSKEYPTTSASPETAQIPDPSASGLKSSFQ